MVSVVPNVPSVAGGKMPIKNFEELEIWQIARRLTQEVYILAQTSKLSRDYGLRDQMQRAAVSTMSNIAEGFERVGIKSLGNFSTSPRHPVVNSAHSSTWPSIKNISIRKQQTK